MLNVANLKDYLGNHLKIGCGGGEGGGRVANPGYQYLTIIKADWEAAVFARIAKVGQSLHCRECDYKSNKKAYIISHIQVAYKQNKIEIK